MLLTNMILACMFSVTSLVFVVLALYTWRRRDSPGGYYFSLLMGVAAVWAIGNLLQMVSTGIQMGTLFSKLTYLGIVPVPVLWVLFNVTYNQRSVRLDRKLLTLWIVPIIILALVFTNDWHHLFWTNITPVSNEPGALLVYEFGAGMWINMAYSYSLMVVGAILLVFTSIRTYRQYFLQTITLLIGAVIPFAGNLIYFLGLNQYAAFDPTPFTLAIMGVIYAWSMFRYQLLDLVPVARETVITNMRDGVLVIDEQGRIIDLNPAAAEQIGCKVSPGSRVVSALAGWPELLAIFPDLSGETTEVQQARQEYTRWFDARVSPLLDNNGMQTGRILILRDITRRKTDEKALEETRRNLQALFDTVDDLIFVVDTDLKILEVNKTVVRRLGYSKSDVVGYDLRNLNRADGNTEGRPPVDEKIHRARSVGPRTMTTKTGEVIRVETRLAPGLWGGSEAIFGISRDITDLVRQQAELKRANESLLGEIEERRTAERQIEVSLHEKDVLLKEVHHRVKNNMQIISSLLNLQKSHNCDEEVSAAIGKSQNRIMSMALIHETLYSSPNFSRIDFADYVYSLTSYLSRSCAANPDIRIITDIGDLTLNIETAIPCGLIVGELVGNSLRHGFSDGRGGMVKVSLKEDCGIYTLQVSDNGIGIGIRGGADDRKADSTGLQLVNKLVDQIQGSMKLDKTSETTFTISFRESGAVRGTTYWVQGDRS